MAFNVSYVFQAIDNFSGVTRRINQSVRSTTQNFSRLKRKMAQTRLESNALKNSINSLRSRVLGIGATLVGAIGVKALVSFGAEMSKVEAVSKTSGKELKGLRDLPKRLGATTVFSASQVASGMLFLARAGFSAKEIMGAIPSVLDLSASSALDLGSAANIVSNVMSGFGVEAQKTGEIADIMAELVSSANSDVLELGNAMKFVGPVARGLGQRLDMTTAALGVLADAGQAGSMSGTGLRRVFAALVTLTPKMQKGFQSLGVDIKKIDPATNDLITVFKELKKANLGVGQSFRIFGIRGGPVFDILTNNIPMLEELNNELLASKGRVKDMAKTMRDNLLGSAKEAISAFEGLIITLGDLGLTQALRGLTSVLTFVARQIQSFIETFPNLSKVIGVTIALLIALKVGILLVSGAMAIFMALLLVNPITLLIVGIVATIAFLIIFRKKIVAIIVKFVEFLKPITAAIALLNLFRKKIGAVIEKFLGFFNLKLPRWLEFLLGIEKITPPEIDISVNVPNIDLSDQEISDINAKLNASVVPPTAISQDVAAQEVTMQSRLDGNININAPDGVVSSVESKITGTLGGNLGMNMATVGLMK